MALKYILVITLFYCLTTSFAINVKDCGSAHGKLGAVKITGCDTSPICDLKKNTRVNVSITFTAGEDVKKVTAVVHGHIAGVDVPFPIDNPDGCKNSGLTCPLAKDKTYTYTSSIFVKSSYPSIKLTVKWQLQDENGGNIICMVVPVEITKAAANKDNELYFISHI